MNLLKPGRYLQSLTGTGVEDLQDEVYWFEVTTRNTLGHIVFLEMKKELSG
jgi:hypothetical protein